MDYTLLRAFNAVAIEGSFSAAAQRLNVSQSTLSTQVKNLEIKFGVELFCRHARGATLTSAGKQLLVTTRSMFAHERDAYELLSAIGGLRTGHLSITAVGPYQVSEILRHFSARYPNLNISVTFGNSAQAQQSLLTFDTDVAVLGSSAHHPDLKAIEYSRPRIMLAVSIEHPWANLDAVSVESLDRETFIRRETGSETQRAFESAVNSMGLEMNYRMEMGSREGMLATVAQGLGIGIVSEEEAVPNPFLHFLRIVGVDVATVIHVACLTTRSESHLIRPFLDTAQELAKARAIASRPRSSGLA